MENQEFEHNINDYCGHSPKELFISHKYTDLKHEIIDNKIYALSQIQINISIKKTNKLMNTFKCKSVRCCAPRDQLHYKIANWSPLKYSHLLALVLYSDWTELQSEFTKTWRKTKKYQTLEQIKDRNREFYHWSRHIRECVEYYGSQGWHYHYNDDKINKCWNNKKGPFYTGMSQKMLIPEVMIRLNGPTSSTKQIEVALRFGGDYGCIIEFDNNSYQQSYLLRCMEMGWITNYSEEDEYLWCGGERRIRISTIRTIENNMNYENYFKSMYYFDGMITGTRIQSTADKADHMILSNLVNDSNCYDNYVQEAFRAYCNHKIQISINCLELAFHSGAIKDLLFNKIHAKRGHMDPLDCNDNLSSFVTNGKYMCDMCHCHPSVHTTMYGCRACDYDLCDNCNTHGNKDEINYKIFKPAMFAIFPNLQYITLVATAFTGTNYYEYPIDIPYLIQLSTNKCINITIRGYHKYRIKLEKGLITDRHHISPSWIHSVWKKMSSEYKSQHQISFAQPSTKDNNGEMISDVLSIECR